MSDVLEPVPTKIKSDGLRYKAKPGGSPYAVNALGTTMSCLLCGQHTARAAGAFKSMFNAKQFICFDCRPPKGDRIAQKNE